MIWAQETLNNLDMTPLENHCLKVWWWLRWVRLLVLSSKRYTLLCTNIWTYERGATIAHDWIKTRSCELLQKCCSTDPVKSKGLQERFITVYKTWMHWYTSETKKQSKQWAGKVKGRNYFHDPQKGPFKSLKLIRSCLSSCDCTTMGELFHILYSPDSSSNYYLYLVVVFPLVIRNF